MSHFQDRTRLVKQTLRRMGERPNCANVERHMRAASLKDGQKQDVRDMTKKYGPHIQIGGRTVWTPGQKRPTS